MELQPLLSEVVWVLGEAVGEGNFALRARRNYLPHIWIGNLQFSTPT